MYTKINFHPTRSELVERDGRRVHVHHAGGRDTLWVSVDEIGAMVFSPDGVDGILALADYHTDLGQAIRDALTADQRAQHPQLGLDEVAEDAADDCGTQPLTDDPRHDPAPAEVDPF